MAEATNKSNNQLLAVLPSGEYRTVPCTYEGIKDGVGGGPFDFVHIDNIGMYIDYEGMLKALEHNVPASIIMGRALYGPVVLSAARPDEEGNTLPAAKQQVGGLMAIARLWQQVVADAERLGQVVITTANESTLPPPQIIEVTDEMMDRWLATGTWEEQ